MIFAIGTITEKFGIKDFEKSSIVILIIKPTNETVPANKIINRSYSIFLSTFISIFILYGNNEIFK